MKAIGYQQSLPANDAAALVDIEVPEPIPQANDLLIQVEAIAVNPVDTKIRKRVQPAAGSYKILGWDACGTVLQCGSQVSQFKPGDRVFYAGELERSGCNAAQQLVDARLVGRAPTSIDSAAAAALPLTSLTAWELLFERLAVPAQGDTRLLIIGAGGGVGSIMIQLAKQLTNATVIATAGRAASQAWVTELGADVVLDHNQPLAPQLAAHNIENVSHIASLTHTDQHFEALAQLVAPQGKIALIDDPEQPLDIKLLKQKSVSLHWEFMYTKSLFKTADMQTQGDILNQVAQLVDQGKVRSTVQTTLGSINATNLRHAHQQLEQQHVMGKIVLAGWE